MTFSDFFDSLGDLDWLAILAGTVALYVFGWIWYGPLFGKQWSKAHAGAPMGNGGKPDPKTMVMGVVQFLVLNVGIAYFMTGVHVWFQNAASFETLVVSAFVLAVFVIGAALFSPVLYLKKSMMAWGLDTGFYFVGIAIAAYVQDLVA